VKVNNHLVHDHVKTQIYVPKTVSFSWWWTTDGQELAQNRVLSYENTQVIIPHLR